MKKESVFSQFQLDLITTLEKNLGREYDYILLLCKENGEQYL